MPIIFGWGKRTVKNFGKAFRQVCDHCHNEADWQLYQIRTWFTLFFIPVIPYQTERIVICPICSTGRKLQEAEFNQLKSAAAIHQITEGNTEA